MEAHTTHKEPVTNENAGAKCRHSFPSVTFHILRLPSLPSSSLPSPPLPSNFLFPPSLPFPSISLLPSYLFSLLPPLISILPFLIPPYPQSFPPLPLRYRDQQKHSLLAPISSGECFRVRGHMGARFYFRGVCFGVWGAQVLLGKSVLK